MKQEHKPSTKPVENPTFHGPGASDLRVGFYICPEGRPHPSLGARLWAAREIARVVATDEPEGGVL
jgi:hypothetical protein